MIKHISTNRRSITLISVRKMPQNNSGKYKVGDKVELYTLYLSLSKMEVPTKKATGF